MRSFGVLSFALTLTILLASEATGQSGSASITVNGQVSEAVFISIAPGAQLSSENLQVTYSNLNTHSVRLSINASGGDARRLSIPVQLRSNVPYTLSAAANLNGMRLRKFCVAGARPTGRLVAANASTAVNATSCEASTADLQTLDVNRGAHAFSSLFALLKGPRISLGGTLETPSNALEVTVLIEVAPQDNEEHGNVELMLSALPGIGFSGAALKEIPR